MALLTYTGLKVSAGISHQKSNLTAMIREASLSGRELLVPHFHLAASHNDGRALVSQLDEYFDFNRTQAAGQPFRLHTSVPANTAKDARSVARHESLMGRTEEVIAKEMKGVSLVRKPLEPIYKGFGSLPVEIPTHPAIVRIAQSAAARIPGDAAWVHVRRGDRLERTAAATSPENIRRVIEAVSPGTRTIYLATNERDPGVFRPLESHYQVLYPEDFEAFRELRAEDNYRLFLAEQSFGSWFPIRISTFKVPGSYFHGSLCGIAGWQ